MNCGEGLDEVSLDLVRTTYEILAKAFTNSIKAIEARDQGAPAQ